MESRGTPPIPPRNRPRHGIYQGGYDVQGISEVPSTPWGERVFGRRNRAGSSDQLLRPKVVGQLADAHEACVGLT